MSESVATATASAPFVLDVPEPANIATRSQGAQAAKPATAAEPTQPHSYRHSETFGKLAGALALAQGEFQEIEKSLTATVTSRREGARSYTYQYADLASVLAAVRPALSKHGLALMQMPRVGKGGVVVTTLLAHGESGEWFANDLGVALDGLDPQAVGSATTYARRYGLTALLGIAAGEPDDDGAAAGQPTAPRPQAPAGFADWWDDIQAVADNGYVALEKAWTAAPANFRAYAAKTHRAAVEQLKVKAQNVTAAAKRQEQS